MSQCIDEINKFEDIKFYKRSGSKTWHCVLADKDDRNLLSIIYGQRALCGANHGLDEDNYKFDDYDPKDDMGYEVLDYTGRDDMDYPDPKILSKKELMDDIKESKEYYFRYEKCSKCNSYGYIQHKVKRSDV